MEQRLLRAMFLYDKGDPKRIQHFVKVYEFAKYIGKGEQLDEKTYKTVKLAAIVHDIGIHKALHQGGAVISHGFGREAVPLFQHGAAFFHQAQNQRIDFLIL